jgi:hypothetical protein
MKFGVEQEGLRSFKAPFENLFLPPYRLLVCPTRYPFYFTSISSGRYNGRVYLSVSAI